MEASGSQENVNTPDHSVLDTLIHLLPSEMNVPGYRFLGPVTKLAERLERGEVGVCPLDDYAREHDIAYANKNADRRKADRVLAERAFLRMLTRTPCVYFLNDSSGEEIDGFFYEQELSRVNKDLNDAVFEVEQVLKTRGKGRNEQYFVSWKGYPEKFNSWVFAADLKEIP
ncbi:hypothetical protein QAD02_021179 [Eretmocerus hayati]|uniref:Uncharacterized protein n=1 Tax=Eretmocerus hayati TaxID=131215 RepID=A0ACC2PPG7_9HYME|nr:hypothetical protein QAD02_021179 [Eretmocerus hayati]